MEVNGHKTIMELYSWSPDFGLPTWHPACLALQTYAQFSGAPVTVVKSDNPFWTPDSDLPVFKHKGVRLHSFDEVIAHLEECKYSTDFGLSAKER